MWDRADFYILKEIMNNYKAIEETCIEETNKKYIKNVIRKLPRRPFYVIRSGLAVKYPIARIFLDNCPVNKFQQMRNDNREWNDWINGIAKILKVDMNETELPLHGINYAIYLYEDCGT